MGRNFGDFYKVECIRENKLGFNEIQVIYHNGSIRNLLGMKRRQVYLIRYPDGFKWRLKSNGKSIAWKYQHLMDHFWSRWETGNFIAHS
jgi:hypothetical protein